jgi:hypothetical protein
MNSIVILITLISRVHQGGVGGVQPPLEKISKGGPKKTFWIKFRNVSFGPPFEISIEFRQKSLKIMISQFDITRNSLIVCMTYCFTNKSSHLFN